VVGLGSGPEVATGCVADAEVDLAQVGQRLARELAMLAPFGRGNDAPRLLSRGVEVRSARPVGDGSHLKLELADRDGTVRGAIAFGMADRAPQAGVDRIDIVYQPVVSSWNGRERVELQVADLAPSEPARFELQSAAAEVHAAETRAAYPQHA
jgi:single-stranded-DNA-specific exonuclease